MSYWRYWGFQSIEHGLFSELLRTYVYCSTYVIVNQCCFLYSPPSNGIITWFGWPVIGSKTVWMICCLSSPVTGSGAITISCTPSPPPALFTPVFSKLMKKNDRCLY